jgi:hypothetical protein
MRRWFDRRFSFEHLAEADFPFLVEWLRGSPAREPHRLSASAVHPRLQQPMRLVDMLYFVAEHDDHHLARMTALARSG